MDQTSSSEVVIKTASLIYCSKRLK